MIKFSTVDGNEFEVDRKRETVRWLQSGKKSQAKLVWDGLGPLTLDGALGDFKVHYFKVSPIRLHKPVIIRLEAYGNCIITTANVFYMETDGKEDE